MKRIFLLVLGLIGSPLGAQNFTTTAEVKPIVGAIKSNWIAVRPWEGNDLLYFTNLLAWRCGLSQIEYSVNGNEMTTLITEPCYEDEAAPNALKLSDILPYLTFDPNSVQTIDVKVTFDDGTQENASFERAAVQIN